MNSGLARRFWKERFNFNMTSADRISMTIVIILGFFISSATAYLVSQSQIKTRQLELENHAYVYLSHVNNALKSNLDMLHNIQGMFNASESVTADEFIIFTDSVLKAHDEIQALEWIPLVEDENRTEHENSGRSNGYKSYEIKEKNNAGKMQRAKNRQAYYPVFYVNPLSGNEKTIGYDHASSVSRRQAMDASRDSGWPIATEPVTLVQAEGGQLGFLIFLAVYNRVDNFIDIQQRRDSLDGFVLAVYRINDLFKNSAENIRDLNLAVSITDITSEDSPISLFSSFSDASSVIVSGKSRFKSKKTITYNQTIKIAGRRWLFDFHLNNSTQLLFGFESILVFIVGFLFTAFIVAYILGNSRRRAVVEKLIKERTQELESVKNEIQQVLDNTGEGICGLDMQGRTTFVNGAALDITGFKEDEFLYRHQHSLIHHHYPDGRDYPAEKCNIYSAYTKGIKTTADDEVFWHKNGSAIPIEYTATPMLDEDEKIIGAVVVFRDISERKKYEAEIITERNNAEEASRAKSTFLATMSHEIRTPMNGMLGMAQLLSDTRLDNIQKDYIDTLIQSGQSLLNQINDILDFSRIEAGKLEIEIHAFSLNKCCAEVIQLMKNRAEEKGLDLKLFYPDNTANVVLGDKHRIQQILLNLVGNAIKFTSSGYIHLNVEYVNNTNEFLFHVTDSGIGIDHEQHQYLFDSFTQADASTTRKYGGSGLGLAISRHLAGLMKGEISVDSTPGKGSVFTLKIPLDITTDDQLLESIDVVESLKFSGNVLLVEDNHVNQKVASAMLTNMGLDVSLADDGGAALKMFSENNYDLILMDCQMPVMDGYTATQKIRLLDEGKDIPILALTANVLPEDIQKCIDAGMNQCLHKPIEVDVLQHALKSWLKYELSTVEQHFSVNDSDSAKESLNADKVPCYVDHDHLNTLADLMGDVFEELIPAYISSTDEFFNDVEKLISNQDITTAERLSHSLKSSSRNVGAMQLGDLAETLENNFREKKIENFESVLSKARDIYQHVRQELLDFTPAN